ncbi:Fructose-1,6-bisphosphatase, cytosolic [Hibiscus syriacus]|uniref:Fructose-1,6-bisphosphatase, cytosolic n=1 Tax=Hibiscus syriacus TaxID=106335 RepID=A0A6A3ACI0_HIBSY|nr:Fructose-1,6-bisphosphatase, cytosolic [Hibiscus syriacus]
MDHAADATGRFDDHNTYVLNEQSKYPESRGDFTILLSHIVLGCKFVCTAVNKVACQLLDSWETMFRQCILVSEDEETTFVEPSKRGRYCVVFDPLDGSSNIDWEYQLEQYGSSCQNALSHFIFGIYMIKDSHEPTLDDVLQPGKQCWQLALHVWSSCTLVLSTGELMGSPLIHLLESSSLLIWKNSKEGEDLFSHEGNAKNWDGPTAKYVQNANSQRTDPLPVLRYIGSMVADVHRTLLYGGIFLYPADKKSPQWKLRVLYEVFPMSFMLEQAGGQAFTGKQGT